MRLLLIVILALVAGLSALPLRAAELVMFEEPGCVWCRRWHAEIGPGYPGSEEGQQAPLVRRDIREGMPAGVQLERPVTSTPTFVLVDGGVEKGRITGYPGADFFYPLLQELLKRLPLPAPADRLPSQRDARRMNGSVMR